MCKTTIVIARNDAAVNQLYRWDALSGVTMLNADCPR